MTYLEYLNGEIKKACKRYEEAKREAIKQLENVTVFDVVMYRAIQAANVEEITKEAATIYRLNELYRMIEIGGLEN